MTTIESTTHFRHDDGREATITITSHPNFAGTDAGYAYRVVLDDGSEPEVKTIGFLDYGHCLRFAIRDAARWLGGRR